MKRGGWPVLLLFPKLVIRLVLFVVCILDIFKDNLHRGLFDFFLLRQTNNLIKLASLLFNVLKPTEQLVLLGEYQGFELCYFSLLLREVIVHNLFIGLSRFVDCFYFSQ